MAGKRVDGLSACELADLQTAVLVDIVIRPIHSLREMTEQRRHKVQIKITEMYT